MARLLGTIQEIQNQTINNPQGGGRILGLVNEPQEQQKSLGQKTLDVLYPSTQALGKTAASIISSGSNRKLYEDTVQNYSKTLDTLQQAIRERESKGEDTTRLKQVQQRALNAFPKADDFNIEPANVSPLQVVGQVAGTVGEAYGTKGLLQLGGGLLVAGTRRILPQFSKAISGALTKEVIPSGATSQTKGILGTLENTRNKVLDFFRPKVLTEAGRETYRALPFSQKVGEIAKDTLKAGTEGLGIGYGIDVGRNLEEGKTGSEALKPSFGTLVGVGLPLGIGALRVGAIPLSSAYRSLRSLRPPTQEMIQEEQKGLENAYRDFFKQRENTLQKENLQKKYGKDPAKFLGEQGFIPDLESTNGKVIVRTKGEGGVVEEATNRIIKREETIQNSLDSIQQHAPNLKRNLNELEEEALQDATHSVPSSDLQSTKNKIKEQFVSMREKYGDEIHIGQMNRESIASNKATKEWRRPQFEQDAYGVVGRIMRSTLDTLIDDPIVRNVNKEIGEILSARKMLESIDGKNVGGGKFTNIMVSLASSLLGSQIAPQGNILAQVVGSLFTTLGMRGVLQAMRQQSFGGIARHRILSYLSENTTLMEELLKSEPKIIQKEFMRELTKYKSLPSPQKGAKQAEVFVPPSIVPPTTYEKGVPYLRSKNDKTTIQTTKEMINPSIKPSIPQNKRIGKLGTEKPAEDTLIQEARKYKSAEEFIKAQEANSNLIGYHGTSEQGAASIERGGFFHMKDGTVYFATNPSEVKTYGTNVITRDLSGLKLLDDHTPEAAAIRKQAGVAEDSYGFANEKVREIAKQQGYEGLKTRTSKNNYDVMVFDNTKMNEFYNQTKSQLTDIWNKANKEAPKIKTSGNIYNYLPKKK